MQTLDIGTQILTHIIRDIHTHRYTYHRHTETHMEGQTTETPMQADS